MGSLCGMMIVRQGRRGVGKMVGRSGRGVLPRAVVKGVGRGASGRRVRVVKSVGSGVGMAGVREDVAGSGIEGDAGLGIGRSGSRGRRL